MQSAPKCLNGGLEGLEIQCPASPEIKVVSPKNIFIDVGSASDTPSIKRVRHIPEIRMTIMEKALLFIQNALDDCHKGAVCNMVKPSHRAEITGIDSLWRT